MTVYEGVDIAFGAPYTSTPPATYSKTLVIIGCAPRSPFAGNTISALSASSPMMAYSAFGVGSLTRAYEQAFISGARSIYLVRLNRDNEVLVSDEDQSVRISNLDTIYDRLDKIYTAIDGLPAHIILPVDVYADDPIDFASQLAYSLYNRRDSSAIGVLGVCPRTDGVTDDQHITHLVRNSISSNGLYITQSGDRIDVGHKLSVVASEIRFTDQDGNICNVNGASAYAGLIASLESNVSPTNKAMLPVAAVNNTYSGGARTETLQIDNTSTQLERVPFSNLPPVVVSTSSGATLATGIDYEIDYDSGIITGLNYIGEVTITYEYHDLHTLTTKGYVALRHNNRRGYVPAAAITTAHHGSQLRSLVVTRIVHEIIARINVIADSIIGEPISKSVALENTVKHVLRDMQRAGAIVGSDYSITTDSYSGLLQLDMTIVPIGDINQVHALCRLAIQG